MEKYIALLRGINVGGHRKIRMNDLKEMFRGMGFKNVATYIQSGNVVFDSLVRDHEDLREDIKKEIEKSFGHDVPVIIRTPAEMERVLAHFPFEEKGKWKGYISFLSEKPTQEQKRDLESQSSDVEKFILGNQEIYIFIDKGADEKPLFSNSYVEKELGMDVTTRNLRSVNKILQLAYSGK